MQKPRGSNTRIQISSREKRVPGKSLNITHNKKIANQIEKELLSKIDNILLECQLNNDLIPTFSSKLSSTNASTKTPNSNLEEEQKIEKAPIRPPSADPKLKFPHSTQNLEFDQNMPDINININNIKRDSKKKLPKVKTKKISKKHKDGFLTGVGIIKTKKEKRQNKFMAQNDEAINEMLHNIDD